MSREMGIPQRKQARLLASRGWPTLAIVRRLLDENEDLHPLVAWRWAHGWSLNDVGRRARELFPHGPYLDANTVLRIEHFLSGRRARGRGPSLERLGQFARLYGCAVADFLGGWHDHLHPQERRRAEQHYAEFVNRRDFLGTVAGAAAASSARPAVPPPAGPAAAPAGIADVRGAPVFDVPARVGSADVAALAGKVDELYVACHRTGGDPFVLLRWGLALTQELISHADYREVAGRELHGLAGRFRRLMAFCAYDTGRPTLARRLYLEALDDATVSADPTVVVWVRLGAAQLEVDYGDPRRALVQLDTAQFDARPIGTPRLDALFDKWSGRAHARLGDRRAAERAHASAERRYEPYRPGRDPHFLTEWWSPADYHACQARSWIDLGRPDRAERSADAALAGVDRHRFPRNHASYRSYRALALAHAGHHDAAGAAITDTVASLDGIKAARILDRFRPLLPVLAAHDADPHVAGALHTLRAAGLHY